METPKRRRILPKKERQEAIWSTLLETLPKQLSDEMKVSQQLPDSLRAQIIYKAVTQGHTPALPVLGSNGATPSSRRWIEHVLVSIDTIMEFVGESLPELPPYTSPVYYGAMRAGYFKMSRPSVKYAQRPMTDMEKKFAKAYSVGYLTGNEDYDDVELLANMWDTVYPYLWYIADKKEMNANTVSYVITEKPQGVSIQETS